MARQRNMGFETGTSTERTNRIGDHAMADAWYIAKGQERVGPLSLEQLIKQLPGAGGERTLVYGPGMSNWVEARQVPAIADRLRSPGAAAAAPSHQPPSPPTSRRADEIDYHIFGEEMQYVEVTLDPGEMVIAEAGGMMFMDAQIQMESRFGDPSAQQQGFFGKVLTAGKRMLTGESLFMTTFTNPGPGRAKVAFAAPYPGKI